MLYFYGNYSVITVFIFGLNCMKIQNEHAA